MDEKHLFAASGIAAGHFLPKVLSWLFRLKKLQLDDAKVLREEMRGEIEALNIKITNVYKEVDTWREKYYQLLGESIETKAECVRLRSEIETMKKGLTSNAQSNAEHSLSN